jgi:hypothetical protein
VGGRRHLPHLIFVLQLPDVPRPTSHVPHPTPHIQKDSSGAAGRATAVQQQAGVLFTIWAPFQGPAGVLPPRLSSGAEKCTEHPPSTPITPPREADFQSDPDGRSRGLTAGKGRQQRRCNYWTPFVPALQTLHAATEHITSGLAAPRGQVPIRGPGIRNATTAWSVGRLRH